MYSPAQVVRGVRRGLANPAFFGMEANRLYHRRLYRRPFNDDGIDVVAEDWDTLLILDACRYDDFEAISDLPGTLERRQSRGSHTVEFLQGNFGGRKLLDTVYVTASPQLYRWRDRIDATFHEVQNVWRGDAWDDDHETVLPETLRDHALAAAEQYPRKRLIVHFVQPHYPFIHAPKLASGGLHPDDEGPDIWGQLRTGTLHVPAHAVRAAYRDNLRAVLPAVETLLTELDGKTVVTSDHGNMFGEQAFPIPIREWGHPPGLYTDELVTVPWLVSDTGARKEITAEEPAASDDEVDDGVVTDRLRQLGYVD